MRILLLLSLAGLLRAEAPPGMVEIPAGEFTMGRTELTNDDKVGMVPLIVRDDRPARNVRLDAFFLDAHEVTHAEYAEFLEATGRPSPHHFEDGKFPEGYEVFPIFNVNWHDAAAYCKWAGGRLPTEAEWERAARGGIEGADYPWGDDELTRERALYDNTGGPGPVGQFEPNGFGLYDMAGGVWEWTADWFERTYYERAPAESPPGPAEGEYRVIRGGSWSDMPRQLRVFFRNWVPPKQRTANLGIRCARDAE